MNSIDILTLKKSNITDFAKERNKLLKNSNSDWNMFLDSDEQITNSKLQITNKYSCYKLQRKTYFLRKLVGIDYPIRIVKKGTGKWVREVHEVWKPNDKAKIGIMKEEIIHNTANNLTDYLSKINNYSTLHAMANLKEGKKSNLFKIIFFPIAKYIVTYFKSKHTVFSIMQSLHSYLSWTKLYFLQH